MADAKGLLDQLLKVGANLLQTPESGVAASQSQSAGGIDPLIKGLLTGVGGGMLGSMLSGNKGGNAVAKMGGTAALATMAYRAYQNYAANTGGKSPDLISSVKSLFGMGGNEADDLNFAESFSNAPDADIRSKAMLLAVINAAKADGEFDEQEQAAINQEVQKISGDTEIVAWVKEVLSKPANVQELAAMATNPQMATEIYLASLAACKEINDKERAYLESLRTALKIDNGLQSSIEKQLFP